MTWAGTVAAFIFAALAGLALTDQTSIIRVSVAFSVAAVLLNLIAVPLFLGGLKHFNVELRQAYIILCVGIGLFGLAQMQLPLVNLYGLSFWVDSGALAVPYLVGVICIFWSMRSLSKLLAIKSLWRSVVLALLVTVIISLAASFLPHVEVVTDELTYNIAISLTIWNSVFITFAAILAFKIRQKIGAIYEKSMSWLLRALAILSFAGWHYIVVQLLFTVNDWYYDYSIAIIPFIMGAFSLVVAGFIFGSINLSAIAPSAQQLIATKLLTTLTLAQEFHIIMYMTNLVSNPEDISDIMDEVHLFSSKMLADPSLSPEDLKKVRGLYIKLEEYLLHCDPIRVFTQDELRARIAKRFSLSSSVQTNLWSQDIKKVVSN